MTSSMTPQERYDQNWERLMLALEQYVAPEPLNPCGISNESYDRAMIGLHDDTWVRDFVPGSES